LGVGNTEGGGRRTPRAQPSLATTAPLTTKRSTLPWNGVRGSVRPLPRRRLAIPPPPISH